MSASVCVHVHASPIMLPFLFAFVRSSFICLPTHPPIIYDACSSAIQRYWIVRFITYFLGFCRHRLLSDDRRSSQKLSLFVCAIVVCFDDPFFCCCRRDLVVATSAADVVMAVSCCRIALFVCSFIRLRRSPPRHSSLSNADSHRIHTRTYIVGRHSQ